MITTFRRGSDQQCPGEEVFMFSLANLLHGFEWKLPHDVTKEELNMEEIFGLSTPRKFPLQAVAEPRLAPHLYTA
ncbi:hypothetical protein PR202_ga15720 [Eleusine coracana subsp. coracana]|uniref:Uncharacterized protein n=1 Tax=Eleusine coracana subsp. coracana TaxID=191504 RepID=A0AAV5CKM2_ELECO|nr:hypothetical protein PR202_ga15720 [Eleusine coracana subsp. coracana]